MPTLRLLPELEQSLRQLPGVRAASVVTGPDRVPTEVHVLAAPGKAAKQVVRDIQSLAMAQYDIDIDHRIVSVVQIGEDEVNGYARAAAADEAAGAPDVDDIPATVRPRIAAITVRAGGETAEATVSLAAGDLVFEGTASGPSGASHRPRLVASAALDAVAELLGRPCTVESATVATVGGREVALTVLTLTVPRLGEQVLTGSALVRGDDADAVCRSVLDALNRQLAG
ncbi:MAG TPA: hypothetical protein VFS29_09980 [Motilibacteraceae bacterium]|nr:hypothetical protein [Motilibacteraceae bacterium]